MVHYMKRALFIILSLMLILTGGSAYAKETFTGKVIYSYTAEKVPSRINILMVPKEKENSFTEADVYGVFGAVYNTRGEKTVEIIPKEGTPSGDYCLHVMISGVKSTVDIAILTEEDRKIQEVLGAINEAAYQKLYEVIEANIELFPEGLDIEGYNDLHTDYQVNVMKRLAVNYTFGNFNEFKEAFNKEVYDEAIEQKKAASDKKGGSSGGGGGGGGSSSVSMPAVPIEADPEPEKETEDKISFSDLGDFEWAKNAIYALSEKNVVSGTGDGMYEPARRVTRAEFSTMLVKLSGSLDENATVDFEDVKKGEWYYPYVASAKKNGYINGRSESVFAPNDSITRYEAVIMVYNVLSSKEFAFENDNAEEFSDVGELPDNIREIIKKVSGEGIVVGKTNTQFYPYDSTTRAEAAVIINRMAEYIK